MNKNKRILFTEKIVFLLSEMIKEGEQPVIDFVLRSKEEQRRLFDKGLSKCDGEKVKSQHQFGLACDIYLCNKDGSIQFNWDKAKAKKWHSVWQKLGGRPAISWDLGHFEYV